MLSTDAGSQQQRVQTALDNLSADGFYLRSAQDAKQGEELSIITQISKAIIMLRGSILRIEPQEGGEYGLAAAITQYRIFSLIEINSSVQTSSP